MTIRIEQIIGIIEEDWIFEEDLYVKNNKIKGITKPDEYKVTIYPLNHKSEEDYNITIAHELLHILYPYWTEELVRNLDKKVYKEKPRHIEFLKDIYKLGGCI